MNTNDLVAAITEAVLKKYSQTKKGIPVGISNRHVHLSKADLDTLFGQEFQLTVMKELSQPGQYASEQKVTLVGPNGVVENVRILGPVRNKTQVEVSLSDCFKLGIKAPVRDSGDLENSAGITLVGPKGSVTIKDGVIIAARHIHMHPKDAEAFGVKDKERVCIKVPGLRGLVFNEVLVRVSEKHQLEMHVDLDEANAASLRNQDIVEIVFAEKDVS